MRKKTNGTNGVGLHSVEDDLRQLRPDEQQVVRAMEDRVRSAKIALADATVRQQQLVAEVLAQVQAMNYRVAELARARGIDPDGAERWNFDTASMRFDRVG